MSDIISRQAAIDIDGLDEQIRCEMCRNPMHTDRGCDGNCKYDEKLYERIMQILGERIKPLPSAQPNLQSTCNNLATDTIYRQAAIDAMCSACGYECDKSEFIYNAPQDEQVILCPEHYALTQLPSAQPDHSDEVKFWKERAEFYGKTCLDLLNDINKGVKISSIEINENGIIFTKEQNRSCDGCKHNGECEPEYEMGLPCICSYCVRRAEDYYER